MARGIGFTTRTGAATIGLAALLLSASPALAGSKDVSDGWAHRSSPSTSPDGWATRTPEQPVRDGFQVSLLGAQAEAIKDGFEISTVELPEPNVVTDGFQAARIELPDGPAVTDGFEVSMVQLPQPATVVDGWAAGELRRAPAIDGWSYAALSTDTRTASTGPAPAPQRQPASPPYELIALVAALAATLAGGALFLGHRRHHHLPV